VKEASYGSPFLCLQIIHHSIDSIEGIA
jgi:hypothetical protein